MRTYATQTSRGFSLLELLIVIAIVGILSGSVMLGFTGADAEQYLKGEADRFAIRVELARQHALQRNREWGIFIEAEAYQFAEFDPERGRPVTDVIADEPLRAGQHFLQQHDRDAERKPGDRHGHAPGHAGPSEQDAERGAEKRNDDLQCRELFDERFREAHDCVSFSRISSSSMDW